MYLTAQKVVRPRTQETGINAFYHEHGRRSWEAPPSPDRDPGKLVADRVRIDPPVGNRVRSYVDLVAPDGRPAKEILAAFQKFLAHTKQKPLPWSGTEGSYLFRLGMDAALAKTWRAELAALLVDAIKLLPS
jgi:hypothetical protein